MPSFRSTKEEVVLPGGDLVRRSTVERSRWIRSRAMCRNCHIIGIVVPAISRLVVVHHRAENPMQPAFDTPMGAPRRSGDIAILRSKVVSVVAVVAVFRLRTTFSKAARPGHRWRLLNLLYRCRQSSSEFRFGLDRRPLSNALRQIRI